MDFSPDLNNLEEMKTRYRVKICGITNREDAWAAIESGADALGFNAWTGSKRFIDLRKEAEWIRQLPPFVTKVAVMVNPTVADAEAVAGMPFIDMIQFHGSEDEAVCVHFSKTGIPFIKAVAIKDAASIENMTRFGTRDLLIDAYSAGAFGGTGRLIDLDLAAEFVARYPQYRVILSGGLNPDNVAEALRKVRPYAVDVASGVEREPGKKDHSLLAAFIHASVF